MIGAYVTYCVIGGVIIKSVTKEVRGRELRLYRLSSLYNLCWKL